MIAATKLKPREFRTLGVFNHYASRPSLLLHATHEAGVAAILSIKPTTRGRFIAAKYIAPRNREEIERKVVEIPSYSAIDIIGIQYVVADSAILLQPIYGAGTHEQVMKERRTHRSFRIITVFRIEISPSLIT